MDGYWQFVSGQVFKNRVACQTQRQQALCEKRACERLLHGAMNLEVIKLKLIWQYLLRFWLRICSFFTNYPSNSVIFLGGRGHGNFTLSWLSLTHFFFISSIFLYCVLQLQELHCLPPLFQRAAGPFNCSMLSKQWIPPIRLLDRQTKQ